MNIAMLLEMAAEDAPARVVVSGPRGGITASELLAHARRAAQRFTDAGVAHVALVDVNSAAVPIALFGAALAGVPFAPVNYRLTDAPLEAILDRLAPAMIIAGPDDHDRLAVVEGHEVVSRDDFLAAAATRAAIDADAVLSDPDAIAVLLFTSGTTGEPKAAVLRHRHLASYIIGSVEFMGAEEDESQLVSVPPYHIAGTTAVLSSLYSGRRLVYLPAFDADAWIATVAEQRVTQAMIVPTMLGRILDRIEVRGDMLASLRHLSYGGGRMPVALIERAMKLLPHIDFVNAYGLTETSSTVAVLGPHDHREAFASSDPAHRGRLGSVGRPLPTVEIEIRDANGRALPTGERGEICVRGEQVAGEYLGQSLLGDDGWFATRDAGWLDADGFLYLDGRLDDVIVRGAENLSPGEIELTLIAHPAVAEAAVVGVPDPEWGEAVAAAIVLAPGAQATAPDLQEWVRARLRSTKTPQYVQFRTELPHNDTGKLLRRVVREELKSVAGETTQG
jgi:acyl-CoA synthetase (AMP-forming)/AMP-acid ligase II